MPFDPWAGPLTPPAPSPPPTISGVVVVRFADYVMTDAHRYPDPHGRRKLLPGGRPVPAGMAVVVDLGHEMCPDMGACRLVAEVVALAGSVTVTGSDASAVARFVADLPGLLAARAAEAARTWSLIAGTDGGDRF